MEKLGLNSLEPLELLVEDFPSCRLLIGFAEATGTELCEGKRLVDVVEIADVELDCAGTHPLAM